MTTLHGIEIKVGDKVFDSIYGWSEVVKLYNGEPYIIATNIGIYTNDGKLHSANIFPRLFWNEFEIPKEAFIKPLPKLEVDTKVLVWNEDGDVIQRRHFSHFNSNGKICCFIEGTTSFTSKAFNSCWDNWELYE